MEFGSVVMTNRTQAVRVPKSVRLPDSVTHLDIRDRGWVITPTGQGWAAWCEGAGVRGDVMSERGQPAEQERDGL